MGKSSAATVWVECPQCRWRREYPQNALSGSMRCRKCGSTVLLTVPEAAAAILPDDDLTLEPAPLPPTSGVDHVIPLEAEYQLAPAPPSAPPTDVASKVLPGSAPVEVDQESVVKPPPGASVGWAFTSNVFTFAFTQSAVVQWLCVSLGLIIAGEFSLLSAMGVMSESMAGALQAGCFGLAAFFSTLISVSYLVACLYDITVNTAYNADKAADWPDPDWRERMWYLLRFVFLLVLSSLIGIGVAQVCSLAGDVFWPVYAVSQFLLFPILMLATLESDSAFWPISPPIFASLWRVWYGWVIVYVVSAAMFVACNLLTTELFKRSQFLTPIVASPLQAAAVFAYARLLGRLTWLILNKGDAGRRPAAGRTSRPAARSDQQLFRGLP